MTIQMLFDAWKGSGAFASIEAPASEAEIQAAEEKIGATLPNLLREVYLLFNGGWAWQLDFFPLTSPPEHYALTNSNEKYIEYKWHIPKEIRLFAGDGSGDAFAIWLPETENPIYNHPVIEVGALSGEDGCMGVAGTNLLSFLRGWSAFRLMAQELDKSKEFAFLDTLFVPQSFRAEHHHEEPEENFVQLRKWADPQLPDPSGDSYTQEYTITDLKRLFGET